MSDPAAERAFQDEIIAHLTARGWLLGSSDQYDRQRALYPEDVVGYVKDTQPEAWEKFSKLHPQATEEALLALVARQLEKVDPNASSKDMRKYGTLGALRHPIKDRGVTLRLCQFKPDHNGETFPVYPEQIFYNDNHPLSGMLPDNARPETWRELDSATYNPSKAESIREPRTTSQEWPPSDELIDSAVVAAIRSGALGEKEMATIRRTAKSEWPDTLWAGLGFSDRPAETINVRVEIANQGTFHHITRDYYTHPCEGDEFVSFNKIQVSVYDTQSIVEGQKRLLRSVTFSQADGTLGAHAKPPEPPWRGTIDEVGCSSRMKRELTLATGRDIQVNLGDRGISIGDHMITWCEVTENGGLDCYYSVTAYGHGIPLNGRLTNRLYDGGEMRVGPKRAVLAALVDQIDYIVANSPSERYGRSPVRALDAAADNPNELIELAFAMPWERARSIQGPSEFANWLEENHPASPRRPLPSPPQTPSAADEDTPEWPPNIAPLTPGGEVALKALLIGLKAKGLLTDEFISAAEGEILLNQPFSQWPPELQEKLMPHGAGPVIR